jgi:hypothetical protein
MNTERENLEEVFRLAMEASGKLWNAVAAAHDNRTPLSDSLVQALMQLRGELHVSVLRPMYKKYPELATKFGLYDEGS